MDYLTILKLLALVVSEIFERNHFVTASAAPNFDDSIKRKCFRVSLNMHHHFSLWNALYQ